ncbi:UTRA domain-containing protein [Streptomyces sp. ACA25]|uniref:GntR family transcriptional regulator n=1 Tax=Streptomyces sp. ACA25 TaxID=3022596 RepID=UPI002307F2FE|nr:UTRA domain-containing protein [Streptomyces sp. ACA25]MDB1087018.1 UTRA domain-containing protein [Streptomyces sp. ACA25]
MSTGEWVSTSMPYLRPPGEGESDAWSAETANRGRRGTQRVVQAGEAPAPAVVAHLLGVPEGVPVIVRRRVMLLDGRPTELVDTYYPADIAGGTALAETRKIPGGAVALLARLGHTGRTVREDVSARMPSEEEADVLEMESGEPVLHLIRVTLDADSRSLQVDAMTMPASRQRLRYELKVD